MATYNDRKITFIFISISVREICLPMKNWLGTFYPHLPIFFFKKTAPCKNFFNPSFLKRGLEREQYDYSILTFLKNYNSVVWWESITTMKSNHFECFFTETFSRRRFISLVCNLTGYTLSVKKNRSIPYWGKKLVTSKKLVTFHWLNFTHTGKSKSFIYSFEILL